MIRINTIEFKYFAIVGLAMWLSGCTTFSVSPQKLGISEQEWSQYSQNQKDAIIQGYQQSKHHSVSSNQTSTRAIPIAVNISGGTLWMPPFDHSLSYQPVYFEIRPDQCNQKVTVYAQENPKQKTQLQVCYRNEILYLDPSRYDPNMADGSLKLSYMPVWQRGFVYPSASSSGYVRLTNVNISVSPLNGS